jgi:hypothetical protein
MKTKRVYSRAQAMRLLTLVAMLFGVTVLALHVSRAPAAKAASVISSVTTNANGKPYIEVDGKPFLPLVVQYREDLHISNLTTMDSFFADAKSIGFNTVSLPIWWAWIEPSQGTWDWTYPDNFITTADQYGLKLEFLWLGTNIAGGALDSSSNSYTPGYIFPSWISSDTTDYQRHINSNGQVSSESSGGWGNDEAFSFTDQNTLTQEEIALQALMNHVATYDTQHALIGVQINNETMINALVCSSSNENDRSYDAATTTAFQNSGLTSGQQFAENQLAEWQNALGQVVKQSNYPVYTRMNYWGYGCGATFAQIAQLAPNIDFEGDDPYTSDISSIRNLITGNYSDRSYAICENGPESDTPTLMLSSYDAGGIYYSTYSLVDGDTGNTGLVKSDHSWTSYTSAINTTLTQLAKDPQDIADHMPNVDIGYFHVLDTNASDNENKNLNGVNINYTTSASGMGVAIMNSNDLLLMGVNGAGTFTVTNNLPDSIDQGYFDANQNWVSTGSASYTNNGNGTFTVNVGSSDFIRLHYASGIGTGTSDLAVSATVTAPGMTGNLATIHDNNDTTGTVSVDNPTFPQYITYTWPSAQSFNQVTVSTWDAQGQAITNFNVEVSSDGSTNWTQVAASGDLSYSTNDTTVETKTLNFARQTGMQGLRIKVNSANLEWKHFAIVEFGVFDANLNNLAPSATLSAPGLTGNLQTIQDNNDATGTTSVDNPTFPQYITYTWSSAQSFDQVTVSTWYAQGQAITNFTVEVSSNGSTWTQVAASGNLTYTTNTLNVETQSLSFPLQTGMVGLRIKVSSANLEWNHFAIIEFKVFNN